MATIGQRFFGTLTAPYRDADIRIRKKASLLAPSALVIGLIGLVLSLVMAVTGAIVVAVFLLGLAAFCASVLYLMAKGRYSLASSLFLYGMFLVMFAAIKFDAYQNLYECYVFGTLGSFLLIMTGLIAINRGQVTIITLLNLGAIAVLYVVDAYPLEGTVSPLAIQSLATSGVLIITGGAFTALAVSLQAALVDESERTARIAEDHLPENDHCHRRGPGLGPRDRHQAGRHRLRPVRVGPGTAGNSVRGDFRGRDLDQALETVASLNESAATAQERVRIGPWHLLVQGVVGIGGGCPDGPLDRGDQPGLRGAQGQH